MFFLCVWGMRKLSGVSVSGAEKMRIVGGLSLGMREKNHFAPSRKKTAYFGCNAGTYRRFACVGGRRLLEQQRAVVYR